MQRFFRLNPNRRILVAVSESRIVEVEAGSILTSHLIIKDTSQLRRLVDAPDQEWPREEVGALLISRRFPSKSLTREVIALAQSRGVTIVDTDNNSQLKGILLNTEVVATGGTVEGEAISLVNEPAEQTGALDDSHVENLAAIIASQTNPLLEQLAMELGVTGAHPNPEKSNPPTAPKTPGKRLTVKELIKKHWVAADNGDCQKLRKLASAEAGREISIGNIYSEKGKLLRHDGWKPPTGTKPVNKTVVVSKQQPAELVPVADLNVPLDKSALANKSSSDLMAEAQRVIAIGYKLMEAAMAKRQEEEDIAKQKLARYENAIEAMASWRDKGKV